MGSFNHYLAVILAIAFFLLILIIGVRTDLLKETNQGNKPYSFRRFQLWIWTLVIAPCFILNWGFAAPPAGHNTPYLNLTALILLGISSATTLTATLVADTQVATRAAGIAAGGAVTSLKAVDVQTTNFWSDILKDDMGQLSVLRLQQLIFTLAYVAIYLSMFFSKGPNGTMLYPNFDPNAFVLMGISTASYVVGKAMGK